MAGITRASAHAPSFPESPAATSVESLALQACDDIDSLLGVEQLDAGLRVLGAGDGMPRLPDLAYYLYVRSHMVNPVTRQVFETLKKHLRLPRTDMPA